MSEINSVWAKSGATRFTISRHDWPIIHADFFLQEPDTCKSEANLPDQPCLWTWRLIDFDASVSKTLLPQHGAAERLQNHRLLYLSYEGEVSNNRGYIKILDHGLAEIMEVKDQLMTIRLDGSHLKGILNFKKNSENTLSWEFSPG